MNELVSIIIPTYNRCDFLPETLDSVIAQTYDNWEAIVIDDGSTDQTGLVMKSYCEMDARIKFFDRPADLIKGGNACRNYGFKQSKGEYVMWLDDDDLIHFEKISRQVQLCDKYKGSISTCSWGRFSEEKGFQLKHLEIYKDYLDPVNLLRDYGNFGFFPLHVFLVPRKLIKKSGLWPINLKINQDAEFFSRVIIASENIRFAEGTYVQYRSHNLFRTSKVDSLAKAKDLLKSWKLIKSNIPKERRKNTKSYIHNGRKHAYHLLKKAGFKTFIFKNLSIFYPFIIKDIKKKINVSRS